MDTNTSPGTAAPAPARLVIHADDPVGARGRPFESPLWRLCGSHPGFAAGGKRAPLTVQIDNLQGLRVHAIKDAGPLTDLRLPAGTYHVTVQFGDLRRSYTMTLEPGASFDLYPRLSPDPK